LAGFSGAWIRNIRPMEKKKVILSLKIPLVKNARHSSAHSSPVMKGIHCKFNLDVNKIYHTLKNINLGFVL
jgi:hypothetical protein